MDLDASDDIEHAHWVMRQALMDGDVEVANQKTFAYCALALDLLWPGHPTYQSTIRWALEHPQRFGMYEWLYHSAMDPESKGQLLKAMCRSANWPQDIVKSRLLSGKNEQRVVLDLMRMPRETSAHHWVAAANAARRAGVRSVYAYCVERAISDDPFAMYILASHPMGNTRLVLMAQSSILSRRARPNCRRIEPADPSAKELMIVLKEELELLDPSIKCDRTYNIDPVKEFYIERIETAELLGERKPHEDPAPLNLARLIREHSFLTDEQAAALVGTYVHAKDCLPTTHPLRARLAGLRLKNLARAPDDGFRVLDLHLILKDAALPAELCREAAAQIVHGPFDTWMSQKDLESVCRLFPGTELDELASARLHPIRRYARHPADRFAHIAKVITRRRNTEAFRRFLNDVRSRPLSPDEARGLWGAGSDLLVPEFNRIALSTLRAQASEAASA